MLTSSAPSYVNLDCRLPAQHEQRPQCTAMKPSARFTVVCMVVAIVLGQFARLLAGLAWLWTITALIPNPAGSDERPRRLVRGREGAVWWPTGGRRG
jgi:hypothetical protein